jgi:hypothetical protein
MKYSFLDHPKLRLLYFYNGSNMTAFICSLIIYAVSKPDGTGAND